MEVKLKPSLILSMFFLYSNLVEDSLTFLHLVLAILIFFKKIFFLFISIDFIIDLLFFNSYNLILMIVDYIPKIIYFVLYIKSIIYRKNI